MDEEKMGGGGRAGTGRYVLVVRDQVF